MIAVSNNGLTFIIVMSCKEAHLMKSKKSKALLITAIVAVILIGIVVAAVFYIKSETTAKEITVEKAQSIVDSTLDEMACTDLLVQLRENTEITVNSLSYGSEKDIILDCSIKTLDVYNTVKDHYDEFLGADVKKKNGMYKTKDYFKKEFEEPLMELLKKAPEITEEYELYLYETHEGLRLYTSDEAVDKMFGNIVTLSNEILKQTSYEKEGVVYEIEKGNTVKGLAENFITERNTEKPDISNAIMRAWNSLKADFHKNFIEHDRWVTILKGLWLTIKLTIFSLLIGIVIGFVVAFARVTYLKASKKKFYLKFINAICQTYLTVIRGTPVVVQIMIIYFVIFMPLGVDKFLAAVICFGLNSGAYVAEIVRGGIMSVDDGQTEAGRSLGFGYMSTMTFIVLPQAFKAVLPALANEFVVLLKETSIAFYIGLGDLMYAGNAIRAATYSAFMPLVAVAIIYFIMVLILSKLVGILERRLRNNER